MNYLQWLEEPDVFQVNREKAHSDHLFFQSYEEMEEYPKGRLRQSLNGKWQFFYADCLQNRVADFYKQDFDMAAADTIEVPAHIQLQGYGRCQYVNVMYPWDGVEEIYPPEIPKIHNAVGSYVKYFDVGDEWLEKDVFLSFQGVETAFCVWLNGQFAGYSEDSFTPSEFCITPYLQKENNKLAVEVYQRSTASWLEDQDFWSFFGIFREVYVYAVPAAHVRDLSVTADYRAESGEGLLGIDCELAFTKEGAASSVRCVLRDSTDNIVWEQKSPVTSANWYGEGTIAVVSPWSAEQPSLYTLYVEVLGREGELIEVARTKVGFRTFEKRGGVLYLNGKRIVFKGVNRHEFSVDKGRAIGEEEMLYDIRLLKKNNINAVRTSHYPTQSRWYELCDEYGIYVIDETNLETHGTWMLRDDINPTWNVPASFPEWRQNVLDRAASMYERDKNHVSILFWSCGNESYCGDNIAAMAAYFREKDSRRLIHYEGVFHNKRYQSLPDVESRMYEKIENIEAFLRENPQRSFILCEYMHAMGNSLGGMKHYMELADVYANFQGGFIWDYIDQALYRMDENGEKALAVGGDFGDRPCDYGFCTDGIVYANRMPSPKMQDVKALYADIRMHLDDDELIVSNHNLFIDTSRLVFEVRLEREGEVQQKEEYFLNVPAGESGCLKIRREEPEAAGEYVWHVIARLAEDTVWAEKGHEVAFVQEVFVVEEKDPCARKTESPTDMRIAEGNCCIGVYGENFSMMFDLRMGGICSLIYDGIEYVSRIPRISFWRAKTDNDCGADYPFEAAQWAIAGEYARHCGDLFRQERGEESIKLYFTYETPSYPSFSYIVSYEAYADGSLLIRVEYPGVSGLPDMPVFALDWQMGKELQHFTYYGMGPEENYCDRAEGARLGKFASTVWDNFSGYLNPQECGNRTGVRYVELRDDEGSGVRLSSVGESFEMSILPYSAAELEHAGCREELGPQRYTWVRVAAAQMGVGGDDSWGAPVHDEYRLPAEQPRTLAFAIKALQRAE